ncbi:tyrosine-type recombinase/integrase [Robiginitalea sp. M366]|uniref:tyrosine-type recombinase/integrase n=1 Tax=Robiginitalea aestuariiviva TaxID=3036903 RepID=UPI00240E505B|nr:tyrosine-type recombinase/integrase [Robiginitalea aestuariiviva]MDG1570708.1 tyrosine-type recombinase/integrase [Robiginitalea aestuariiviva]
MALEAFRKYLALERKYAAHTVQAYLRDLQAFAVYCEENHPGESLVAMPYSVIRSWIIHLMESGLANRTINRKVASLKAYYKYMVRQGALPSNPLTGHRPLRVDKKVELPFSEAEMRTLLSQWPDPDHFEGLRDKLVVELLYATGMRRAELIGLQLKDLDLQQGTLRVLGKRNKERIIPLLAGLKPQLGRYLALREAEFPDPEAPYIFLTVHGNKMYPNLVYRIINKYLGLVSAKVKKSPHMLRHTFATHMLNKGADMNAVKELLGHASLASTQVYTHNSIATLKKVHGSAHPRNKN